MLNLVSKIELNKLKTKAKTKLRSGNDFIFLHKLILGCGNTFDNLKFDNLKFEYLHSVRTVHSLHLTEPKKYTGQKEF